MTSRFLRLVRLLTGTLSAIAALLTIGLIVLGAALYADAGDLRLQTLRLAVQGAGKLAAGQTTRRIELDVDVTPASRLLHARATLNVRATTKPRSRFYFLLNPGLQIEGVRARGTDGHPLDTRTYRMALAMAVELENPVAAGTEISIAIDYAGRPELHPFGGDGASFRSDRIVLGPETFWYPYDAQSFFDATISLQLPANLNVAHNGVSATDVPRGTIHDVTWRTERPVAGLALVAGAYRTVERRDGDVLYRVLQSADGALEPDTVLDALVRANSVYTAAFGESGYSRYTVFLDREIRRAFNDGSGMMGAPPRYFRDGDNGYNLLAHELAHVWWGGTVSERWLQPGTGGQWLVEGLATASAAIATEERYGQAGLERVRRDNFFDPERQVAIEEMSFLDNALNIETARDTIYRKGGYVGLLLRHVLGPEAFARTLRAFLERYRYTQATLHDFQQIALEQGGEELLPFLDEWLRTDHLPDFALAETDSDDLVIHNRGRLPVARSIELETLHEDGTRADTVTTVGGTVESIAPKDVHVVDPHLVWPDMKRADNRWPRSKSPFSATADAGRQFVVLGSGLPWERCTAELRDDAGTSLQVWDFSRGIVGEPSWSSDGTSIAVELSRATRDGNEVLLLGIDGSRRSLGSGSTPIFDTNGDVLAERDDRIVRIRRDDVSELVIERPEWQLATPQLSATGRYLLYRATRGAQLQLRVLDRDTTIDRVIFETERDSIRTVWARDESAVYATIGHGSMWQLLRIPLVDATPSILGTDIASVSDLELSPGGTMLAIAAASAPAYPDPQHTLFTIDLRSQDVKTIPIPDGDVRDLSWTTAESILATVRVVPPTGSATIPADRRLWRVDVDTGMAKPIGE